VARDARLLLHRSREIFRASIPSNRFNRAGLHRNLKPLGRCILGLAALPGAKARPDVMIVMRGTSRQRSLASGWASRERRCRTRSRSAKVLSSVRGLWSSLSGIAAHRSRGSFLTGYYPFKSSPSDFYRSRKKSAVATRQLEEPCEPSRRSACNASIHFTSREAFRQFAGAWRTHCPNAKQNKAVDPHRAYGLRNMRNPCSRAHCHETKHARPDLCFVDKIVLRIARIRPAIAGKPILIRIQTPEPVGRHVGVVATRRRIAQRARGTRARLFHGCAYIGSRQPITGASIRQRSSEIRGHSSATIKAFAQHILARTCSPWTCRRKAQSGTRFRCADWNRSRNRQPCGGCGTLWRACQ